MTDYDLNRRQNESDLTMEKEQENKNTKNISRIGADRIDNNTALFRTTFLHGALEFPSIAYQGSHTNLMSVSVFEFLKPQTSNKM